MAFSRCVGIFSYVDEECGNAGGIVDCGGLRTYDWPLAGGSFRSVSYTVSFRRGQEGGDLWTEKVVSVMFWLLVYSIISNLIRSLLVAVVRHPVSCPKGPKVGSITRHFIRAWSAGELRLGGVILAFSRVIRRSVRVPAAPHECVRCARASSVQAKSDVYTTVKPTAGKRFPGHPYDWKTQQSRFKRPCP